MTAANEKPDCPCCGSDATWQEDECVRHTCTRCRCQWWESQRRAQTAEAMDDAEYTQGFAYDGVVILKDGEPVTIDEVLAMLNARSGTVDERLDYVLHIRKVRDGYVAITSPTLPGLLISGPDINECLADVPESVALLREANARARGGN